MKPSRLIGGLLLSLTATSQAHAQTLEQTVSHTGYATAPFQACLPMGTYHITGISANELPVQQAIDILFTGTPWSVNIIGSLPPLTLSYSGVSGPLDQVLAQSIEQAGQSLSLPVVAVSDPTRCLVTISTPSTAPAEERDGVKLEELRYGGVLPAGEALSAALEQYAEQQGWTLRWNIDDDYLLDVDLPLPAESIINTITWVVNTYQSQGGLAGVAPRFAQSNKVVVIEHMNVRESN